MSPLAWIASAALCLLPASSRTDPTEINFATLSAFEYVEGMTLPEEVTKYDGKVVTVSGFVATEDGSPGPASEFLLINDGCGCEGIPLMNEVIFCSMTDGSQIEIGPGIVSVTGTLDIGEELDYGVVVSLYRLDATKVDR